MIELKPAVWPRLTTDANDFSSKNYVFSKNMVLCEISKEKYAVKGNIIRNQIESDDPTGGEKKKMGSS